MLLNYYLIQQDYNKTQRMVYGLSTGSSLALDLFLYPTISIRIDVIVGYTFVSSACDVGDSGCKTQYCRKCRYEWRALYILALPIIAQ